ncbi:hypothetical protein ACFV2N_16735 [Streptomyces sp. NPDC059680]|uniref:hypothetical protein n=1 Tax=Streptomyces sp. NPDC059680 TaxID=3346904 RepID=UPI0036B9761A
MATMCGTAGCGPAPVHWARSVTSRIAMVECGLGVTVVPAATSASRPAVRFLTAIAAQLTGGRHRRRTTDSG